MIFLISCWVAAAAAANIVVVAPRIKQMVNASSVFCMIGCRRINRKMPATTIVLEWSRADTGVGPSMAAGSHGCRPNWADFPAAAAISPISGMMLMISCCMKSSCIFIDVSDRSHAVVMMRPMSPIRL